MDTIDSGALQITLRRYGPTVHLTLAGELDHEADAPLARVRAAAFRDGVDVLACDLHHVRFMDVSGLRCLLGLQEHARAYGITVLAYNWQPQPLRLLRLLDGTEPCDENGLRALLDLLGDHTGARLTAGIDPAHAGTSTLVGAERRPDPGPPPASQ
ncbi:STAS domain-containing protein [Streptomyces sp. NPDC060031]|uniref:STAS domain-containing protein n=1 Tax=Streptomyces sp. NPDC060031 TaxID=3347043 RepID=UPI0036823177